jgi:antitoxin component YwqK of YwqJK toxin-antitoxin module
MRRLISMLLLALTTACGDRACGGRGGLPPPRLPMVKLADGRSFHLLDKGQYKALYDTMGQLAIVQYDSNNDGRADYLAYYEGKQIRVIEVDENQDSWIDRWEHYDASGVLEKIGRWRKQKGKADVWRFPGPGGLASRVEYDDDGDGRSERSEIFRDGQLVRIELDSDRDGRRDRWQTWEDGRLKSEELDTKGAGTPDRRLVYGGRGGIARIERLQP